MQKFQNLAVWRAARQLAGHVYRDTVDFPVTERFGLSAQMRRAAISICSNIAEGCGRGSDADFRKFLLIAMASACELECETILAHDLALLSDQSRRQLLDEVEDVKRMLAGLIKRLCTGTENRALKPTTTVS